MLWVVVKAGLTADQEGAQLAKGLHSVTVDTVVLGLFLTVVKVSFLGLSRP